MRLVVGGIQNEIFDRKLKGLFSIDGTKTTLILQWNTSYVIQGLNVIYVIVFSILSIYGANVFDCPLGL